MDEALERNVEEYRTHWSGRFRRTYNYSTQTKVRRFRSLLRRRGLLQRDNLRVFDYGFGLGVMLFCFRRTCSIAGVELGAEAVCAARASALRRGYRDVDLRQGPFPDGFPAEWVGRFDVVICSHVLEHLSEPKTVLSQLASLVSDGGSAVLVVPINESPGEDLNHFSCFSQDSFVKLVVESGLQPDLVFECDRLWDVIAPMAYAQQRRRSIGIRLVNLLINAGTCWIPNSGYSAVDGLLRPFGCRPRQLFAVCRRDGRVPSRGVEE